MPSTYVMSLVALATAALAAQAQTPADSVTHAPSADKFSSADIPRLLQAPTNEKLILQAHASGWQIYSCGSGSDNDGKPKWTLKAPDADLLNPEGKVLGHHSAGPMWKYRDGSEVTAKASAHVDSPDEKSIPWLLLTAVGHSGKGKFANVTSIQRVHTIGGQPPAAAECNASKLNAEARSSYTADYYFYAPEKDK